MKLQLASLHTKRLHGGMMYRHTNVPVMSLRTRHAASKYQGTRPAGEIGKRAWFKFTYP